ncbi:MAG: glycine--tRNA ligase subunit beta [Gammaproteobacteria bacterium]
MTNSADFLVELGTEELPPKALLKLRDAFADGIAKGLAEARLEHGEILKFASPRRLAVIVQALATEQPTQVVENKGPPVKLAYDEDGKPTKAAEAFAHKNGIAVNQLETTSTDKGEWLFYRGEVPGKTATELLGDIVNASLTALPVPKRMRWGDSDVEFVRPAHWLVMLLGDRVVDASVLGLQAGSQTYGHRFHAPQAISLTSPGDYEATLNEQGKVITDFEKRRDLIRQEATEAAAKLSGEAILDPGVLDEVTALVEWPVAITGAFDESFLRLPREVLIYTLQDHQKYFPVEKNGVLLPAFLTMSNLESREPERVKAGNERVVLPRLADAEFFFDQDAKTKLAERQENLANVVYQKGLGSLQDKCARVSKLAIAVAPLVNANMEDVERAAALARTDLLTDMVGEFPILQGRMGYYYAILDGENENVAVAIEEQYLPRQAGDRLPATPAGQALSLADRLDTLAGIFALGKRPSGNKDPFSLRRQALGIVRLLIEGEIDADLPVLLQAAAKLQPVEVAEDKTAQDLYEFILDRMRAWYLDGQAPGFAKGAITPEMFEAVRNRAPSSLLDFHQRLGAVQRFMTLESAESLAAANKRIANILKKAEANANITINEALFDAAEEKQLHAAVIALVPEHESDLANRNYESALQRLANLREPVDGYFDQVMVMTDDEKVRANRLAQLGQLRSLFLDVADISCIQAS